MRDLMAVTAAARGDLARRRPAGHEHVPGRGLRGADGARGRRLVRRGAPVRPDRGPGRAEGLHRPGDGGRGHGRRARRPARHDGRPAGHRPRVQDAARPRRRRDRRGADLSGRGAGVHELPGRRGADRARRRRHARRRDGGRARPARRRGAGPEVHLHGPVVPEPRRRDAVAGAPAAARGGREAPRAARARGQPVRAAALRGRPAADALLARRRRVRHLPRDVLEDPLARPAARLDGGAAPGAREAEPRQGQHRPLLVAAHPALRDRLLRRARLARVPAHAHRPLPAAARRDARRAGRALPARGHVDAAGGRAVHLGDAAGLHRHHRPARAGAAGGERRVRARAGGVPRRPRRLVDAAELLRRRRRRDPRGRAADRQGRGRAGGAVRDADRGGAGEAARRAWTSRRGDVLPLRRRAQ